MSGAGHYCLGGRLGLSSCQGSTSQQNTKSAGGSFTILHTNDIHGRHRPCCVSPCNATALAGDAGHSPSSFERTGQVGGFAHLARAVDQMRAQQGAGNVLLKGRTRSQ